MVVHDHFRPYAALTNVDHAFCNAHHLRELQALIDSDKEPWALAMRDLLIDAAKAVRQARQAGQEGRGGPRSNPGAAGLRRSLLAGRPGRARLPSRASVLRPGKERQQTKEAAPGHNLLIRLNTFKGETLRFLVDFDVPFTNNLAEQDLRMTKVKMKISGSFRTFEGARVFVRLRSIVSTARKQGCNILQALTSTPANLLQAIAA